MSTPHKAKPADWAWLEGNSTVDRCDAAWSRGLIELRARIEALEAGATCPHIMTSDEGTSYCGLAEQVAAMESAAPPAGSLVEQSATFDEDENDRRLSQPLSPAAQSVLDAVLVETAPLSEQRQQRTEAAATLRAAADQVERKWRGFAHEACQEIRAMAAELDGTNPANQED